MPIVAKLDELGKPAWIALMIFGFCVFWPLGFAVLAFALWSGRMGCWRHGANNYGANNYGVNNRWRQNAGMRGGPGTWWQPPPRTSGNRAFDEYRSETLKRLEDEQREFHEFLDRLRMAKDKSEFDQFMAERRDRPNPNPDSSPQH